jgi:hypothetical protein
LIVLGSLHQTIERLRFHSFHFLLYIICWGLHNAKEIDYYQTTINKMLGHICYLLILYSKNSYMPTLFLWEGYCIALKMFQRSQMVIEFLGKVQTCPMLRRMYAWLRRSPAACFSLWKWWALTCIRESSEEVAMILRLAVCTFCFFSFNFSPNVL